jgi:hypothetical protein
MTGLSLSDLCFNILFPRKYEDALECDRFLWVESDLLGYPLGTSVYLP